jgi:predicted dehydrogenase
MLKFSTGAIGILETSWLRPDGPSAPTAVVMEVMGTQGMIELIPFASSVNVYTMNRVQPDNQAYVFVPGAHGRIPGMYREEASHFLECIATGRRPICTGRDALSAVVIADAIERSVATNSEIQVETGS